MSEQQVAPPILVVEDSPDDCTIFQDAVRMARLTNPIRFLEDGAEAVAYLCGEGEYADRSLHPIPALIFLDINLPKLNGLEVLQKIRTNPDIMGLPVVMLTVSNSDEDVLRSYELGTVVFIQKPVTPENLTSVIQSLQQFEVQLLGPPT
jgi:CheY-like chemotaxis protein